MKNIYSPQVLNWRLVRQYINLPKDSPQMDSEDDYDNDIWSEIDRDTERKIKEYEEKEKIRIVILIQQNFRNKHYIKELQKINICNDLISVILKYL